MKNSRLAAGIFASFSVDAVQIVAGGHGGDGAVSLALIAGKSRLQTEAATMTPAAKERRPRLRFWLICLRIKNTHAAPKTVPKNGMARPCAICNMGSFMH